MVNKIYSIYREKKEVKKKSEKGSNDHMTIGKGEMENITVMSQRSHDRWNLEMKGGPIGGEGRRGGGGGGEMMSLKVIYFQSIFLIYFYLKRLIYVQKYGITNQSVMQQVIQEKEKFLQKKGKLVDEHH